VSGFRSRSPAVLNLTAAPWQFCPAIHRRHPWRTVTGSRRFSSVTAGSPVDGAASALAAHRFEPARLRQRTSEKVPSPFFPRILYLCIVASTQPGSYRIPSESTALSVVSEAWARTTRGSQPHRSARERNRPYSHVVALSAINSGYKRTGNPPFRLQSTPMPIKSSRWLRKFRKRQSSWNDAQTLRTKIAVPLIAWRFDARSLIRSELARWVPGPLIVWQPRTSMQDAAKQLHGFPNPQSTRGRARL